MASRECGAPICALAFLVFAIAGFSKLDVFGSYSHLVTYRLRTQGYLDSTSYNDNTNHGANIGNSQGLATDARRLQSHTKLRIAVVFVDDLTHLKSLPQQAGAKSADAWGCYCAMHGYYFFVELLRFTQDGKVAMPNSSRPMSDTRIHATIKYLPFFDYVVQVSPDTYVANRSFPIDIFLQGSPDVVLSMRSQQNRDFSSQFPKGIFSEVPDKGPLIIIQLQTDVMIVKSSLHGLRFCHNLLRYNNIVSHSGTDMTAAHRAALEFVLPETDELKTLKEFGRRGKGCYHLPGKGLWGHRGPFCNEGQNMLMYYKMTTEFLARHRDYEGANGHLRVLPEGELVRDWIKGKLMIGGDFIVHTKKVFCNTEPAQKEDVPCDAVPLGDGACTGDAVPHPELFEQGQSSSVQVARSNAYNVAAVFAKSGFTVYA